MYFHTNLVLSALPTFTWAGLEVLDSVQRWTKINYEKLYLHILQENIFFFPDVRK